MLTDKKTIPGVWIYISDDCKFTKREQAEIIELIGLKIDTIRTRVTASDDTFVKFDLIRGFEYIYKAEITLYEKTVMIVVKAKIEREY